MRLRLLGLLPLLAAALMLSAVAVLQERGADAQAPASPGSERMQAKLVGVIDPRNLPTDKEVNGISRRFLHVGGEERLTAEKAQARLLPRGAGISTSDALPPAPDTLSAGVGFDGISYADTTCLCRPPDGAFAAGPNHLIGAVNTAYKVWDKAGHLLLGPADLGSFLLGCNIGYISDPFVDYDAAANRFVLGALSFDFFYDSSICIAVSQSGDPTKGWNLYQVPVARQGGGQDLFDFPQLAIGSDAFYVTGNQFLGSGLFGLNLSFGGVRVYAFNKSQMYARQSQADGAQRDIADLTKDTLRPARSVDVAKTMYFVSVDNECPCNNAYVWKWSDPFGSDAFALQGSVPTLAYDLPPNAAQPGGEIVTNDARTLGAQLSTFGGERSLWGVQTIGCNPGAGAVACVHWFQIGNIDAAPALLSQGTLAVDGEHRFYPNIAVNNGGNVAIGYAFSSASKYAGVGMLDIGEGVERVAKAGEATTTGDRYGDYAGTALDPNGCTIWHLEEYAKSGTTWGTWVTSLDYGDCTASTGTPTPVPTDTLTPVPSLTATPTPTATPSCSPGQQKRGGCGGSTATPTNTPGSGTPTPTTCPPGKQKNGGC